MSRNQVASTNMASVGYDEDSQTLEIEFTNGSIYQYYNVNFTLYDELMHAPSKGQFFNVYIRNNYPYTRYG